MSTDASADSGAPVDPPAAAEGLPDKPEAPERKPVKTTRQRAEERREAKLEQVQELVESGSLVIRKMTDEERELYPPRPPQPGKRR